jgi:hypothetical protein
MYMSRAYDDGDGQPVVVLVASGTHDVSRLVATIQRGTCEQANLAAKLIRQVNRHNGGRAALALLRAHGGPDLLAPVPDYPPATFDNEPGWVHPTDRSEKRSASITICPGDTTSPSVFVGLTPEDGRTVGAYLNPAEWETAVGYGDTSLNWATHRTSRAAKARCSCCSGPVCISAPHDESDDDQAEEVTG